MLDNACFERSNLVERYLTTDDISHKQFVVYFHKIELYIKRLYDEKEEGMYEFGP